MCEALGEKGAGTLKTLRGQSWRGGGSQREVEAGALWWGGGQGQVISK